MKTPQVGDEAYELGYYAGYSRAKDEMGIGVTHKLVPLELSDHPAHGM